MIVRLTILLLSLVSVLDAQEPVEIDVLLKNGTILDGTGSPRFVGNVGLAGDKIVGIGEFEFSGVPFTVDCSGLVIAPGFIDLHNHSDWNIVTPEMRSNLNFLTQGCTTVVTGNCGAGPVDADAYYKKIEANGAGTNIVHLLPQGNLRGEVIGQDDRKANTAERRKMERLAKQAMEDGVWGMSTGLIYVPSVYADTDELVSIAEVVGKEGGIYVSHMRGEGTTLLASVAELIEIGERAKLPVHVSHFKASGKDAWGLIRQAVDMIDEARKKGQVVTADQYPYIASSTSLEATLIPTWARAGGHDKLMQRINSPDEGTRIREAIERSLELKDEGRRVQFARFEKRPEWVGQNLYEVAQSEGKTPLEIALYVTENRGASIVNFSMDEEDVRYAMQRDWVATASDGRAAIPGSDKPHPRFYGTFPRKIGHYCLQEEVLPLEQAIRSASGLPADILGMKDRGYLKLGQSADVVVFDPEKLIDNATFQDPHRYSQGVKYLFVNGTITISDGHPTGALAGRALRKPRP
ncbi:MAG TPA: D-aminoacylase [Planctomycetaceae bacterium]|nr:D-aminoacylase [Planctomycetaceae bacterium]